MYMKKLFTLTLCFFTLFACKKDPLPDSAYAPRGLPYQVPVAAPVTPTKPVTPISTTGILVIENTGKYCGALSLKVKTGLFDVPKGYKKEVVLNPGTYEYAQICGIFEDCSFLTGILKYDKSFTIIANEKTTVYIGCR
jgi:hypothetical protein